MKIIHSMHKLCMQIKIQHSCSQRPTSMYRRSFSLILVQITKEDPGQFFWRFKMWQETRISNHEYLSWRLQCLLCQAYRLQDRCLQSSCTIKKWTVHCELGIDTWQTIVPEMVTFCLQLQNEHWHLYVFQWATSCKQGRFFNILDNWKLQWGGYTVDQFC